MKLVVATIHPVRLRAVKEALDRIEVQRVTICDSQESVIPNDFLVPRHNRVLQATWRRMVTLEIAVNDDFLDRTLAIVQQVSRIYRGLLDNSGFISVLPIEAAVSFFPETTGPGAL